MSGEQEAPSYTLIELGLYVKMAKRSVSQTSPLLCLLGSDQLMSPKASLFHAPFGGWVPLS